MNELVYLRKDEMFTDSLTIAESFERRHDDVVKSIEKLIERNNDVARDNRTFSDIFSESSFCPITYFPLFLS